jgi:hypothetical protein
MKTTRRQNLMAAALACGLASTFAHAQSAESPYKFERGYPAAGTGWPTW